MATFFTFPDGVLSYSCAPCGACCRGLGVGLDADAGEHLSLVERHPAARLFLRRAGGAWSAKNPRGACWFLRGDGLCRLEAEGGRAAKPAVCRLFPFNRIFKLGEHTIIDYNSVVCPLEIATEPLASGAVRVTWDALLGELEGIEDAALTATPLPLPDADPRGDHVLAREGRIATACFEASRAAAPAVAELDAILGAKLPRRVPAATLRQEVARAFEDALGAPARLPTPEQLRRAALLTPSMRFNTLFGKKFRGLVGGPAEVLAAAWLAWLHLLAEAEVLAERPLSLQQATSVWSDHLALMLVVALWRQPCQLEPGPAVMPGEGEVQRWLMALGAVLARAPLGFQEATRQVGAVDDPFERIARLGALEPVLERLQVMPARRG